MTDTRLSLALDSGALVLPETGLIAVLRPPATADLSALPRERVVVVQGFRPDHDAFVAAGYAVATTPPDDSALSIVVLPRAKAEGLALLAEAAAGGGPVVLDGLKAHGVESVIKALRSRAEVSAPVVKAHGKLVTITVPPGALDDWRTLPTRTPEGWHTAPGLFSADGPDPGSVALADALPPLHGKVADLGAGWGYLAARALADGPKIARLDLVEAEHAALDAARANVIDPRARFHWADARTWQAADPLDHVLCNPPFHTDRAADPSLGQAFIAAAARLLGPRGTLWLVANRHLPYEAALRAQFREVAPLPGPSGYKLVQASAPVPQSRPRARGR